MKKLIILMMLSGFVGFAQCEMIVENDDIVETTKIFTNKIDLGNLKIHIQAGNRKGTYPKITFKLDNICVNEGSPIYYMFESGEKFRGENYVYGFNCSGYTGQIININKLKNLLMTQKVKTLRIYTGYLKYLEIDLTSEQAEEFMNYVKCSFDFNSYKDKIKYKGY